MTTRLFPEDFLWGVATAGHQNEGDNRTSDTWFLENVTPSIFAEPSGRACNSWELWEQDLDLVDQHVVPPDQEGRVGEEVIVVDRDRAVREIDVVVAGQAPDHGAVQLAGIGQAGRKVGHVLDRGDAFERALA